MLYVSVFTNASALKRRAAEDSNGEIARGNGVGAAWHYEGIAGGTTTRSIHLLILSFVLSKIIKKITRRVDCMRIKLFLLLVSSNCAGEDILLYFASHS